MIDDKQYSSPNGEDICQLYVKSYKKLEEKEKFIEDTVTKFNKMMESGLYMANPQLVGGKMIHGEVPVAKEYKTVGTMSETNELVRDFPKKELSPECENLVIGSSVIGKVEIDKPIQIECGIQADRGSTTNKNIKVCNKYDPKIIRTLVIQGGTNNVLKQ